MHSHNHSGGDKTQLFGVAALAAGIGALTAALLARQSGAETRQALRDKFREAKAKPRMIVKDIDDAADSAKDIALKAKDKVADSLEAGVDKAADKIDKIKKD